MSHLAVGILGVIFASLAAMTVHETVENSHLATLKSIGEQLCGSAGYTYVSREIYCLDENGNWIRQ